MHLLSDSSIAALNTFLQWFVAVSTGLIVFASIGLIFVTSESGRRQELRISTITLETENAKKDAAVARAQAAQANEKAESERLERMKLETSLAPRSMHTTSDTTKELKLFAGTRVVIAFNEIDLEARSFARQIAFALRLAKWNISLLPTAHDTDEGICVLTKRPAHGLMQEELDDAAEIITYQLRDNRADAMFHTHVDPTLHLVTAIPFPDDAVLVIVGAKREAYFEDKMREEMYKDMDASSAQMDRETLQRLKEGENQSSTERRARIIKKYTPMANQPPAQ